MILSQNILNTFLYYSLTRVSSLAFRVQYSMTAYGVSLSFGSGEVLTLCYLDFTMVSQNINYIFRNISPITNKFRDRFCHSEKCHSLSFELRSLVHIVPRVYHTGFENVLSTANFTNL